MNRKCLKCNKDFPLVSWIHGKRKNFQRRKYCLDCSPFGHRNTRKLEKIGIVKLCKVCGKPTCKGFCHVCYQKRKQARISDKVHAKIGEGCWLCGYSKGREMLDLHHMDPSQKLFCITVREKANLAWEKVWKEIQKCSLLCCRCHREVEYGYVEKSVIEKIYQEKWSKILGDMVQKV